MTAAGRRAFQEPPGLTLITDTSRYADEPFFEAVEQSLAAGVDGVLVREKLMDSARLLAFASRLRALTAGAGARLLIHSRADVAQAVDADGVHLAAGDIGNVAAVRSWLADDSKSVSVSCHNAEELEHAADAGADFCLLSPVFPTASHPGSPHLGVAGFRRLTGAAKLPVVALGGITVDNCSELHGWPVAVISAVLGAENPAEATARLAAAVKEGA